MVAVDRPGAGSGVREGRVLHRGRPGRGPRGGRGAYPRDAPTTSRSREADAVLICVPTPLTATGSPTRAADRLLARRWRACCAGPARRARVHDLPGTTRERSRRCWRDRACGRAGIFISRSRPSAWTRAARIYDRNTPKVVGGAHRGRDRARLRCTRSCATGRARCRRPEAAELVKLLENSSARSTSRWSTSSRAHRPAGPRRLGGRRRRGHEAVRLHALQAGSRHGRALSAGGPST